MQYVIIELFTEMTDHFLKYKQVAPSKYIQLINEKLSIIEYTNLFNTTDYIKNKSIKDVANLFREEFKNF